MTSCVGSETRRKSAGRRVQVDTDTHEKEAEPIKSGYVRDVSFLCALVEISSIWKTFGSCLSSLRFFFMTSACITYSCAFVCDALSDSFFYTAPVDIKKRGAKEYSSEKSWQCRLMTIRL